MATQGKHRGKWACEPYEDGEGDWIVSRGHHDDATFIAAMEREMELTTTPEHITREFLRFIPVRGEPNDDTWADNGYFYDEIGHGYWIPSKVGRGAIPFTQVERRNVRECEGVPV